MHAPPLPICAALWISLPRPPQAHTSEVSLHAGEARKPHSCPADLPLLIEVALEPDFVP